MSEKGQQQAAVNSGDQPPYPLIGDQRDQLLGPAVPQAPVLVQPAPATTTVVMSGSNADGAQENVRDWSSGLCGCFSDFESCCFATWCWSCFLCSLSSDMGEDCLGPIICGASFWAAMRTKTRIKYGIRGSIMSDHFYAMYCPMCAMCQIAREIKAANMRAFNNQVAPTVMTIR